MGRIGQALARRARGFNMRVIYHNRSRVAPEDRGRTERRVCIEGDLLKRADHVVLVLPYTAENHHTIGAAELACMKPTATLTNHRARRDCGRRRADPGACVTRPSRRRGSTCSKASRISIAISSRYRTWCSPPHIASATESTRRAMANLAADNLIAALGEGPRAGNPPNPINPEVLKK